MIISYIRTRDELADLLNIPRKKLTYILYVAGIDNYYTTFEIPKKHGGTRQINAPSGDLKNLQKILSIKLWEYQKNIWKRDGISPNISHAFEKNKSIITNAKIHRNKRVVINVDLENFFDSFHFGRVCGFFEKNKNFKYPHELAVIIAQLTCYKGSLPQGAPTSPIITNMICQIFDMRILKLAKKYHLDYTRYADDLSFSTNDKKILDNLKSFYDEMTSEIVRAGFKINEKKTRVQYKDSRQTVTGLTVNKKINIDHKYYKRVRAMAYSLYSTQEFTIDKKIGTVKQLEGMFSFIDQIDKYNNLFDSEKIANKNKMSSCYLTSREKQYQKFLFYRYFFANDKPLIITEGKTDIRYIKSALKNLYKEYPSLIEKDKNGKFVFKVSFLKRTKRLCYFFGLHQDGADTIKNLYNYFSDSGENKSTNYLKYFLQISKVQPTNPVILIYDNEISNSKKPLYKFLQHAKISPEKTSDLCKNLRLQIIDNSNLFLVTNPLVDGKSECEIEDLFDSQTKKHKISGKTFSLDDKADKTFYYGKEIFSDYIQNNYDTINFDNFKPILNNICYAVSLFKKD